MKIGLHKGKGPLAKAIQWQTRSPYSHASVFINNSQLVEAVWPCVRIVTVKPDPSVDCFAVHGLTASQRRAVTEFLLKQIGKPYDITMVARFVTRQQETRESQGKWFCSELVFAAFKSAGIDLLSRIEPWEVSPGLLANSPLLIRA